MKSSRWRKIRILFLQKSFQYGSWLFPDDISQRALRYFSTPQHIPTPESEKAWVAAGQRVILQDGICTYQWGPADGPGVLLIHGWSGRGTQLGAFMPSLVKLGYRVVAMDGPAHGESIGSQTNVGSFANALVKVQKQIGPLQAALGHSFGAGCLVLAAKRGMQTRKLVLIGGPADYGRIVKDFTERMRLSPRCARFFMQRLTKVAGIGGEGLKVGELGAQLGLPALIVHDEDDKEVRFQSALEVHAAWKESQLLVTHGLGHRRIMRDEAVIRAVTEFVSW